MNRNVAAALFLMLAASIGGVFSITFRADALKLASDEFAGTPPGDIFKSAQDLAGDLRREVRSGSKFIAMMDSCPWDDEGWDGDSDPLGTIKCGEDYVVHLDLGTMSWVATGRPDSLDTSSVVPTITGNTEDGVIPFSNAFGIWGGIFQFDENSAFYAEDGTRVGTIRPRTQQEIAAEDDQRNRAAAVSMLESQLRAAESVKVILDACTVSDDGWKGDSDPLGTIKCGETYTLKYLAETDKWKATGFNEASEAMFTSEAVAAPLGRHMVVIWGAEFTVDADKRAVFAGEPVGRVEIVAAQQ